MRPIATLAHSPGYCSHAYTGDGEKIVTGGYDSHLRLYSCAALTFAESNSQMASSGDGLLIESGGDSLTCVTAGHSQYFASGSEDGTVVLYRHTDGAMERHLLRRNLPVRCLSFHPMGRVLAVAGDELEISLVDVVGQAAEDLKGHGYPLLCLAYDPLGKYLGSLDASGVLKIWNAMSVSAPAQYTCLKTMTGLNALVTDHTTRVSLDWSPDGQWLAVPSYKDIRVFEVFYSSSTGLSLKEGKPFTLGHTSPVSGVRWSPRAQFLACYTQSPDHVLILWSVKTSQIILKHQHDHAITSLAWRPSSFQDHGSAGLELTFMDNFGQLQTIRDTGLAEHAVKLVQERAEQAEKKEKAVPAERVLDGLFEAESKKVPKRSCHALHSDDEDSASSELEEEAGESKQNREKRNRGEEREEEISAGSDYQYEPEDDLEHLAEHVQLSRKRRALTAQGRPAQPAFQPGATPIKYKRQFLVWNLVGTIVARIDSTGLVNMDVEFHDKSQHRPLHFADSEGYSMASLSERAALFASEQSCHYIPFGAWAPRSDWTLRLDAAGSDRERFCAIAVGKKWAALATRNPSTLRILSSSGLQSCLFSLPSKIVAMAAARSSDSLFMMMESEVWIYDMEAKCRLYQGQLPGAERAVVTWLGFMDWTLDASALPLTEALAEVPVYMDSMGILRALLPQWDHVWAPILDTRAVQARRTALDEEGSVSSMVSTVKIHYWPIGVTPDALMCVIVKGDEPFPIALPRPPSTLIKLKLPVMTSPSAFLEERWLFSTLFPSRGGNALSAQLLSDKLVLEMIKMALDADRSVRVLDLCLLLTMERSFEFAVQLAQHKRMMSLAERIEALRRAKMAIQGDSMGSSVSSEQARVPAVTALAPLATSSTESIVPLEMTATALKAKLRAGSAALGTGDVTREECQIHTGARSCTDPTATEYSPSKKRPTVNPFATKARALAGPSEEKSPLPLTNVKLGQFFVSKSQSERERMKQTKDQTDKENDWNEPERESRDALARGAELTAEPAS